jgi:hypothetical protein
MAQFEFEVTEVNRGFIIVDAETLDEASEIVNELYYNGEVAWDGVDVSFNPIQEEN